MSAGGLFLYLWLMSCLGIGGKRYFDGFLLPIKFDSSLLLFVLIGSDIAAILLSCWWQVCDDCGVSYLQRRKWQVDYGVDGMSDTGIEGLSLLQVSPTASVAGNFIKGRDFYPLFPPYIGYCKLLRPCIPYFFPISCLLCPVYCTYFSTIYLFSKVS